MTNKSQSSYAKMTKNAFFGSQLILAALWHHSIINADIDYSSSDSNVSYSDVVSLPFRSEDELHYYGETPFQFARLWLPDTANSVSKLIVFIHGGCWLNEFDMAHTFPLATALSQAGYAVWSLEYRRTGDEGGGWPGSFDDIKRGINLLATIENHDLNSAKLAIIGHSAGGHLALLAGKEFPQVRSIIGLAAITDIEHYSRGNNDCQTATPLFMGGTYADRPTIYDSANPKVQGMHKNTTLLHGTADNIVDIEQSSFGNTSTGIVKGAGHFDWVHPGTPAVELLLKTLEETF